MTQRKQWVILICAVCLVCGVILCVAAIRSCTPTFQGSRVKNPDAYLLDIRKMNGTDLHTLELNEGDVLRIHFETTQGALYMEIKAPDGSSVYRGDGKAATDFTMRISQRGVYTISVEARQAAGTIHIHLEEDAQ